DDRLNGLDGRRHGHVGVYRYVSPAQHDLAFVAHGAVELLFASQARCCFLGKKDHRHTVFVWWRKLYALRGHVLAIEGIGYLDENTRAVSHEFVSPHGSPVVEVFQDLESLLNDRVAFMALDVSNKTDSTRVVLVIRVIQTLRGRVADAPGVNDDGRCFRGMVH